MDVSRKDFVTNSQENVKGKLPVAEKIARRLRRFQDQTNQLNPLG